MGDRICLKFTDGMETSPTLYAHWEGANLLRLAEAFWDRYNGEIRAEPSNWMVNFIAYITEGKVRDGEYYLYPNDDSACSPDDNGYWVMNINTGKIKKC